MRTSADGEDQYVENTKDNNVVATISLPIDNPPWTNTPSQQVRSGGAAYNYKATESFGDHLSRADAPSSQHPSCYCAIGAFMCEDIHCAFGMTDTAMRVSSQTNSTKKEAEQCHGLDDGAR